MQWKDAIHVGQAMHELSGSRHSYSRLKMILRVGPARGLKLCTSVKSEAELTSALPVWQRAAFATCEKRHLRTSRFSGRGQRSPIKALGCFPPL